VAEDEGVEGETPTRPQRRGDALEHLPLLLPSVQMEERAERDVDQRGRFLELELPDVAEPQLERQAGRSLPRDLEHRRRRVDPEHGLAGLAHDFDRNAAASDHQLGDRPVRLAGERDVVGHVLGHVGGPGVVNGGPGVVFAHRG